ncbi:MAG: VanZ family protein [Mangrovicoccus sp.]|nr:VanZ family protein [Mangrovicoccus sp.]
MGLVEAFRYLAGVSAWAAALACLLLGLLWLAGRRPPRLRDGALAFSALFVVFLAIYPFPDPASLNCANGGKEIRLQPFRFFEVYALLWQQGKPLEIWLTHRGIIAPVMNVLLFTLPGIALAWHSQGWPAGLRRYRWAIALGFGMAISLFNELSQLSALYGIYPCRYRFFEVDDLILNPIGVVLGFALMRAGRILRCCR